MSARLHVVLHNALHVVLHNALHVVLHNALHIVLHNALHEPLLKLYMTLCLKLTLYCKAAPAVQYDGGIGYSMV